MRSSKPIGILFSLLVIFGLLPLSLTETEVASAQDTPGIFEGEVPVQGAYLQVLDCFPQKAEDNDLDYIWDRGCNWDDNGDGVIEQHKTQPPLIVDLEAHAFFPGDNIMIGYKESIYDPNNLVWGCYLYGLFSSTNQLLTENWVYTPVVSDNKWPMVGPVNRVPGAIDAALGGYVHGPQDDTNTWKQGYEVNTDIPQDFRIYGRYEEWNAGKNGVQHTADTWWFSNCFWIQIPPGARFLFLAMTNYWIIGDAGYCKVQFSKDSDYDALPDWWELMGIDFNMDGTYDLTLTGADYSKKDIYVEVDYMEGHRFNAGSRDDVAAAFSNCPGTVRNGPIAIHSEIDDSDKISHSDTIKWSDFKELKNQFFGQKTQRNGYNSKFVMLAKHYTYHYCIFVHNYQKWDNITKVWTNTTSGGLGEYFGDDFMVSLGSWTDGVGSRDEQASTYMHELGHNLKLDHGGGDDVNYKPNYMSIMNYLFEDTRALKNRPLTFSSKKMPDLNEANLDEIAGLGSANWDWSARSKDTNNAVLEFRYIPLAFKTALQVDWDDSGGWNRSVQANVNNFPRWGYTSPVNETLQGFDDWSNLRFYFMNSGSFKASFEYTDIGDVDMTWELVQTIREDAKNMGGPTDRVQIVDGLTYPSPNSQSPSPQTTPTAQTTNPFFNFFDQVASFVKSNLTIVGASAVAVISLIAVTSLLKRRKRKSSQSGITAS